MKTITTTVYDYAELNDEAKGKAKQWFFSTWPNHGWHDTVVEDAAMVKLKLSDFSMDSTSFISTPDLEFMDGGNSTAQLILENHGEDCDTYKAAIAFEKAKDAFPELPSIDAPDYAEIERRNCEAFDALEGDFMQELGECYRRMLQAEYDAMFEESYVANHMAANDYTFTVDGKCFG